MHFSMFELATRHNGQGLFCLVGRFDFGTSWAADHTVTSAVERQAQGRFHFHTFRASAVVDDAVCLHSCMQRPYDISIVDRRLVEDARPFGILSTPLSPMVIMHRPHQSFACTSRRCSCCVITTCTCVRGTAVTSLRYCCTETAHSGAHGLSC
jgi:hypothetical protein